MMARWIVFTLLLLAGAVEASITVGWRMPIERIAPDYLTDGRIHKLEKPPGESAFFEAGDELWDVSQAPRWPARIWAERADEDPFGGSNPPEESDELKAWKGEWIVWNARSGMFVARGSWNQILLAEAGLGFQGRARVMRTKIEVESGGEPVRSLSLVSRSSEEAALTLDGISMKLTGTTASEGLASLDLNASWTTGDEGARWALASKIVVQTDSRTLIARHGSGESGWQLFATLAEEAIDGVPMGDGRLIEVASKLQRWLEPRSGMEIRRRPLDGGRWIASYPLSARDIERWEPDPQIGEMQVPPGLKELSGGPLLDMSAIMKRHGIETSASGSFAGYDLAISRVVMIADSKEHELLEDLLSMGCEVRGRLWISTNEASGGWGLTSLSGERASITRSGGTGGDLVFEIEPTLGGNERILDLKLKMDVTVDDKAKGRLESGVTLQTNTPAVIARRNDGEGAELPVEVTASYELFDH